MHPREGWTEDRRAGGLSRRGFLKQGAAAGLLAAGAGSLLAGCSSGTTTTSGAHAAGGIPLPRPNNPVTWPLSKDNPAIKSGLAPEQNATLRLFNWVAYINPDCLKAFGKKYNCKVEVTTFQNMDEALAKLRSGQLNFDVFFPTVDVMAQLVYGKLIQPLNHSYIPNITQAWPDFTNPFYDGKWQYTVPYTIYTTGIAWRKDHVAENPYTMANPWAMPWQAKYKNRVAILDDAASRISLGLMKNGIFNLNTTNPSQINAAGKSLQDLAHLTNVHIDNNDYTEVPSGQIWIHHAWSGDMAAAQLLHAQGRARRRHRLLVPAPTARARSANDTDHRPQGRAEPGARAPVPQLHARPAQRADEHQLQRLHAAAERRHPAAAGQGADPADPSLMSTAVLPSYFRRGVMRAAAARCRRTRCGSRPGVVSHGSS